MEALTLFGAPPERYWPYDGNPPASNTHFDVEPPAFCYAFGSSYQALTYFRLDPGSTSPAAVLASIKAYVAAGFPCMFGFPVYQEFETPLPGGLVAFPATGSRYYGGHANVVAGYDDNLMIGADKGRRCWSAIPGARAGAMPAMAGCRTSMSRAATPMTSGRWSPPSGSTPASSKTAVRPAGLIFRRP